MKLARNKKLRSELLLPKVLQTFADFFNKWNIEDIKTVLQSFTSSVFWNKSQHDICSKSQFLLCLTKNGWVWKREDANQNFVLLPDVKRPELLQAVFQRVNKSNLLVRLNTPRLGIKAPSAWPVEQICRLWDAAAMLDEKSRYDSITLDFLEQALLEIKNTEKQLPNIQKYLKAINMAQYRNAREQLGRILHAYPHCCISFAKDNWTTVSFELWKRILALATDCLPLDLPSDETISFRYTERDLQKILPELEKELSDECDANCKAVIRDLVCSCFRNSMKDWQTSPLAKCRLFSVQDQLCSFADLKQMLSSCRLFRTGGDIQTPQAIKKAVRWNFEILPNNYCDALKNILDIGVFSKEKHIPEIFRMKPDLSDANNRIDLLKKLKAEADTDKYYNAVRYLLHGLKDQYEYYGDILAAGRRVNRFSSAYRRKVAIALIGKHELVGISALYACSHRRSASVSGLYHIAAEIIVRHYGAAYRANSDGLALDTHFVDDLSHQSVHDSVRAAGAVMERNVSQRVWFLEFRHITQPPFRSGALSARILQSASELRRRCVRKTPREFGSPARVLRRRSSDPSTSPRTERALHSGTLRGLPEQGTATELPGGQVLP